MLRSVRHVSATLLWTTLAASTAVLLTACSGGPAPAETSAPPSASSTSAPTAEPTETAAPTEEPSTPFAIACDALVTLDQLYAFNPNFSVDPAYSPDTDLVSAVVDDGGTACGYVNQSSGEVIAVAVATPSASALEQRGNTAAAQSTAVPTYGTPPEVEGYFTQAGGRGQAQVFTGPYWIVLDSPVLFEPGDAQQLVADVVGNLPAS